MNVYRIEYFMEGAPTSVNRYVAADTMPEAMSTVDPTYEQVMSAELLGGLMFAKGEAVSKAMTGGRQVTLEEAKASIHEDGLVSFEDGKKYLVLTRHVKKLGMTFDQYKTKWGLPVGYPSTHPLYSIKRRDLALASGLGGHKRK
jgi:predicted transcriptional regulator